MRILIQGTSGAGKTSLAKRLARVLGIPHIELDAINWQRGWRDLNQHDRPLFIERTLAAIRGEDWVCDGNYGAVRAQILARATDLVMLDYDRAVVMRRVVWRSLRRALGRRELWAGTGNREHFRNWLDAGHPIRWAWSSHARRRAEFRAIVEDHAYPHLRLHHLRRPREAEALVEKLEQLQSRL